MKPAQGIRNPFIKDWKRNFFADPSKRIASIPFLRNLIEYTDGNQDGDFLRLTSLLHWKPDSAAITQENLDEAYNRLFSEDETYPGGDEPVTDMIIRTADSCINGNPGFGGIEFHDKIVLSIAIRVAAERFMAERIDDEEFLHGLGGNPTSKLLERFEQDFGNEKTALDVIRSVLLMTPENIHLNSFMYEPIVDMSDEHLKRLYRQVKGLTGN